MEPPAQQVGAALSDDAPSLQASFGPSHGRDGAAERSGRSGPERLARCQVRSCQVGPCQVGATEVGAAEIGHDVVVRRAPYVPGLRAAPSRIHL